MLFVSYRRGQLARVQPVVNLLRSVGVQCFLDIEDIDPLDDFPARLRDGIDRSHAMLAWWSADYGESDFCMQEFRRGWQHARRRSSDVGRRLWVLNPEAGGNHIFAGELNSQNFLRPPDVGSESAWAMALRCRLESLILEGPLAEEPESGPAAVLYNVPIMSADFSGRGRELMSIHSKLHPARLGDHGVAVAVQTHGMAGIGKTELAAAYAREFSMAYPGGVFWLNLAGWKPGVSAVEDEARSAWLRAIEQTLGFDSDDTLALTRTADGKPLSPSAVRDRLRIRMGSEYLWILDNFPEISPVDLRDTILSFVRAPSAVGHTLLTTRDGRVADGFVSERLEVLSEEDALRLLARFRPSQAHSELLAMHELIREAGAHTQALILLGEHARNYPGGYPRVLEQLLDIGKLERIEQIAQQLRPLLGNKARGIVATFALSIEPRNPSEKELLALGSVCAPNLPIPDALLAEAFGGRNRDDEFNTAMSGLLRSWLLSRREDNMRSVFIHPLVAAAATRILQIDTTSLRHRIADVLLERLVNVADNRTHGLVADDIPQAGELGGMLPEQRGVRLLMQVAMFERARGRYAEEKAIIARALSVADRVLGSEHPDTLAATMNLATTMNALGDLARARAMQEQMLPIFRRVLGEEHVNTLTAMGNLAGTLRDQGDFSSARSIEEQVLSIRLRVLGEAHIDTLSSMNNLAGTMGAQGDFSGARLLQERVLAISRGALGIDHPESLTAMMNLAQTFHRQGDYRGARVLIEYVLPIRREVLGKEHPQTLIAMSSLASTMRALNDLNGARAMDEEVFAIRQRVLGDEHPRTLVTMNNLSNTLGALGDLSGARLLQERAMAIRRRTLGSEHPDTLSTMNSLARTLGAQGDWSGARALQEELLAAVRRVLGHDHPNTLTSMSNLAFTLGEQGEHSEARALQEHVLEARRRVLGREHPDTSVSAWILFQSLRTLNDLTAAGAVFEENLRWLIDCDPSTLGADQTRIRGFAIQEMRGGRAR